MYFACAIMNSTFFAAGVVVLTIDHGTPLDAIVVSHAQTMGAALSFVGAMIAQAIVRCRLISDKASKGF